MKIEFFNYLNHVIEIDTNELLYVIFLTEKNKKYNEEGLIYHKLSCEFKDSKLKYTDYLHDNKQHNTKEGPETQQLMDKFDKLFSEFTKFNVGVIQYPSYIEEIFVYYKPELLDNAEFDTGGSCFIYFNEKRLYLGSKKYVEFIKHLQREIPLSQFG